MSLSNHDRRVLLRDLAGLDIDEDRLGDIKKVFLPLPLHGLALRPEILLIRGERGAGKTTLFRFLYAVREAPGILSDLFPALRLGRVSWLDGFSEFGQQHPAVVSLDALPDSDARRLRLFWSAHLACRLIEEKHAPSGPLTVLYQAWHAQRNQITAWLPIAELDPGVVMGWLDRLDAERSAPLLVLYDHLDRISLHDAALRERHVGALLALWLSLSTRYRHLRAKIFLREDLYQVAQRSFPDASKLRSRAITLEWDREALFRMLLRHLASRSRQMRDWICSPGAHPIPLTKHDVLGYLPPPELPEQGLASQKAFADHLVGEVMEDGAKKAYTYRWLPNRLQDAHIRIAPRSLVDLIACAACHALRVFPAARGERLLTPADLFAGLQDTSKRRVAELQEEYPFVARLQNLKGLSVLLDREEAEQWLALPVPGELDRMGSDGKRVLDELVRIGVLRIREGERVDVPDIYRYGFEIKRKGGVAHPR